MAQNGSFKVGFLSKFWFLSLFIFVFFFIFAWNLMQIILGSSSSSRKQILAEMGYDFTVKVCWFFSYFCFCFFVLGWKFLVNFWMILILGLDCWHWWEGDSEGQAWRVGCGFSSRKSRNFSFLFWSFIPSLIFPFFFSSVLKKRFDFFFLWFFWRQMQLYQGFRLVNLEKWMLNQHCW